MIGHLLLQFSPENEDAVLTRTMRPFSIGGPCLVQTAHGGGAIPYRWNPTLDQLGCTVGERYDALCERFGAPRINAAIRNRILSNRARRVLGQPLVSARAP